MNKRLDLAEKAARRSRRIIAGLVVSLVLDITLTVLVTVFALQAHNASAEASATVAQLHASEVSSCQASNQTRFQEIALWSHIYAESVTPKTPPKELKADQELIAYIKGVFAPRNCAKLYRIQG